MKKFLSLIIVFCFSSMLVFSENKDIEKIVIIPIHGEIDKSLMVFIRRSVEKARNEKAGIVIFDIDTFGGRVDSALQITTLIGSLKDSKTVAYVTAGPESKGVSWSAGALISFSCSEIYMSPGTSMGAAAPVYQTNEGMKMAEEKVVSAVRTQMAALAEKNDHPKAIALAMVDSDVELKEIFINGKMKVVTSDEMVDVERSLKKTDEVEEGKIISKKDKLLTLTANEMEKYGVSLGTYSVLDDLIKSFNLDKSEVISIEQSSSDKLISLITSGAVMSILIAIALVSLYIEINSPGFGVPGTISLISFAVIFTSNALLGRAGSLELLIFLIGVILLILEIFIIPGFGVAGISGIVLIVLSLVLSMQDFYVPTFDWQWDVFVKNIMSVGTSIVISVFFILILAQILPKSSLFQRLTLNASQKADEGYVVQGDEEKNKYLNKKGVTVTVLRPSGKAEIDDNIVEVISDGEFIEKGINIEVTNVTGNEIMVKRC